MATRQITIEVPEEVFLAEKTDPRSFGREMRVLSAVRLYGLGRLSSGRAAELEFLHELKRYNVFPPEAELTDLEEANG